MSTTANTISSADHRIGDCGLLYTRVGAIAVVPVEGMLTWSRSSHWYWGGDSFARLIEACDAAAADAGIEAVLLDMDCPGSTAAGISDAREALLELAAAKPLHGIAHDQATSGGQWLLALCAESVATPTATLGSIGTVQVVYDSSAAAEKHGERAIVLSSSPNKGAGFYGVPITDDMLDDDREWITHHAELFFADVAESRGLTPEAVRGFDARIFTADAALAARLIDRVTPYRPYLRELVARYAG